MSKFKLTLILILFSIAINSQQSIFWKVTKGDTESYVFGTYHYLGESFLNENKIILDKLKESKISMSENIDSAKVFINAREVNLLLTNLKRKEMETLRTSIPNYVDFNKMSLRELIVTIDGKITSKFCIKDSEKKEGEGMDGYLHQFSLKNNVKLIGLEPTINTFKYINQNTYVGYDDKKMFEILKSGGFK